MCRRTDCGLVVWLMAVLTYCIRPTDRPLVYKLVANCCLIKTELINCAHCYTIVFSSLSLCSQRSACMQSSCGWYETQRQRAGHVLQLTTDDDAHSIFVFLLWLGLGGAQNECFKHRGSGVKENRGDFFIACGALVRSKKALESCFCCKLTRTLF